MFHLLLHLFSTLVLIHPARIAFPDLLRTKCWNLPDQRLRERFVIRKLDRILAAFYVPRSSMLLCPLPDQRVYGNIERHPFSAAKGIILIFHGDPPVKNLFSRES